MDLSTYDVTTAQGSERFRGDALRTVGILEHPRANELFDKAWNIGWEGGLEEILICLWDLAEMEGL